MHEAHARVSHARHEVHGKCRQAPAQVRESARRITQSSEDLVGARHFRVAHVHGIRAAATRARLLAGDFGLHVAAQRRVREHLAIHMVEIVRVHVEPVEVAVENDRHRLGLGLRHRLHALQRLDVSVESPGDVDRV
jgi:hypothetical protein